MADEFDPFKPIDASDFATDEEEAPIEPDDVGLGDNIGGDDEEPIDDLLGGDEVDPVGDDALGGLGGDSEGDIDLEEPSLEEDGADEVGAQQMEINAPKWQTVPQDNSDIVCKHNDGYLLHARPLSAKQGSKVKYAAQVSRDGKIIDKGVIWVNRDVNPVDYLQNVSDRILSKFGYIKV